jgi:hypothetical protein
MAEESGGRREKSRQDKPEHIIRLILNPLWIRQAHHERIFNLSPPRILNSGMPE